jgi:hypothetical protein
MAEIVIVHAKGSLGIESKKKYLSIECVCSI